MPPPRKRKEPQIPWTKWFTAFAILFLAALLIAGIAAGVRYWNKVDIQRQIERNQKYVWPPKDEKPADLPNIKR